MSKKDSQEQHRNSCWERMLPLLVVSRYLPCRDLGRLLLCTSKSTTAAAVMVDEKETSSETIEKAAWETLCLQYWGADNLEEEQQLHDAVREFVQQTGLGWKRCFRELSHLANKTRQHPHKYFTPFDITAGVPPVNLDPAQYSLVIDLRRRNTGKRLFCEIISGYALIRYFTCGSLRKEVSTEELCEADTNTTSGRSSKNQEFSWDGQVHLIRHSDQTVIRLMDLHQTDTLFGYCVLRKAGFQQDTRDWNFWNCLIPKHNQTRRDEVTSDVAILPREPPHHLVSMHTLFGWAGVVRLGLELEYQRTDPNNMKSPFLVSGIHLHANLLSRYYGQELLLEYIVKGTPWTLAHVVQVMELLSNNAGR